MKVPKYIRNRMHRAARLSKAMETEMRIVDGWFGDHGFDIEKLRNGDGASLEEIEYGNDVTDVFCEKVENGDFEEAAHE